MKIDFTEFLKKKPTYCVSIVSCWISVVVGHDQKLNIDGWMAVIDSGWCLNMVSSQSHRTRCQHSFEWTSWKWYQIHVKNWVRPHIKTGSRVHKFLSDFSLFATLSKSPLFVTNSLTCWISSFRQREQDHANFVEPHFWDQNKFFSMGKKDSFNS